MVNSHPHIPQCKLIEILTRNAELQSKTTSFDYLGILDAFFKRVSEEVYLINLLFPEYTPHDEKYHLKGLLQLADNLLSDEILSSLNSSELLLLAISIYGHDWGMAVSESERIHIQTNRAVEDEKSITYILLDNENKRFLKFFENHELKPSKDPQKEIPIKIWQDYIRETHSERSSNRVAKYFETIGNGVGIAAAKICLGHSVDFESLEDFKMFPTEFSVLGEIVNIRALSIYLRLIDLYHLGDDRTPFVIWKFVSPKDHKSKMEWNKHRALSPVTFPSYQGGRTVLVNGSTNDHEVFAALKDLEIYCNYQLKRSNDILARINNPKFNLNIFPSDWKIETLGFKPISIQFEFNRNSIFQILSQEIYQNDPYVFLRELLINSIDAIKIRQAILKKHGISIFGKIEVKCENSSDGDSVITWTDNGIGMDGFVIKNYFAVAGSSFYKSKEFKDLGLQLDPISEFGIGILSCFNVADQILIKTYKDPHYTPSDKPYKITIPDLTK